LSSAPGWASIVSLISFLLGVVIAMLGITGEYLWRIFDEINKRPDVVIDEMLDRPLSVRASLANRRAHHRRPP
jgi:hypothetical protein